MIYQHATDRRDQVIAAALSGLIDDARSRSEATGTPNGRGT